MRTVHVGIGHDNNFMIPCLRDIKAIPNSSANRPRAYINNTPYLVIFYFTK